jgi:hypothetical protein
MRFETFRSEKADYHIDPARVKEFLDELVGVLGAGEKRREVTFPSELPTRPTFQLYWTDGLDNTPRPYDGESEPNGNPSVEQLCGTTLYIKTEQVDKQNPTRLTHRVNLGEVHISQNHPPGLVLFNVHRYLDLAVNPDPLYKLAEKYRE